MTDLSQVTDKLYHIILYQIHPTMSGIQTKMFAVICRDCIGSFKSNYHAIKTINVTTLVIRNITKS